MEDHLIFSPLVVRTRRMETIFASAALARCALRSASLQRALLPLLCRLWAAAGAGLMRDWLTSAGVLRARPAAADALAGLLGLELDEAHAARVPVVRLALEFSGAWRAPPAASATSVQGNSSASFMEAVSLLALEGCTRRCITCTRLRGRCLLEATRGCCIPACAAGAARLGGRRPRGCRLRSARPRLSSRRPATTHIAGLEANTST